MICWMSERPLSERGRYAIKHTTRTPPLVKSIERRVDVNTLDHVDASQLGLNEIAASTCTPRRR